MKASLLTVMIGTSLLSCAKKDSSSARLDLSAKEETTVHTAAALDEGAAGKADDTAGAPAPSMPAKADGRAGRDKALATARSAGVLGATAVDETPPATAAVAADVAVAAGEWDDNANFRDYTKWLAGAQRNIARLDVASREFLVVTDKNGKPVPNCSIAITGGKKSASLVTMASGRALLFPNALGLSGQLTATATCAKTSVAAPVDLQKLDAVTKLVLDTQRELPARRTVDLAFVLDTTGSMSEEIEAVKSTIRTVASKLSTDQTDVRIGLVEYKDRVDAQVTRTYPFSSDIAAFSRSVAGLTADGGGDTPEDMQAGLAAALDKLQWRGDAVSRMIVVIADAPPHLDYQDEKDFADASRRASARGIKIFTVSASGMDDTGQIVMRQMAQYTGASNMFVLRGGAGPQSVGGGDPKSSCGGTHENYTSGNLDQLIVNKIRQELKSLDADPMQIAGRGQDEKSKPCKERIVMATN